MTDKTDLIREIHEYVATHGGENTATHLLVQAASAIQTLAAELEAVGAGGVQALSAAPAEWKLVPVEPTNDMQKAADEWAAKGFDWPKAVYRAMLAASPTPPAEQQATAGAALGGVYARLPDFDSGDEPIWEAVFKWKTATPGSDASKKAMAVESAIIKSLRDFADRTHALRMEQAAPKAAPGEPDRGDATNLARNTIKYPDWQITAKGVHCLAEAVLEMDKYIADFVNAAPKQEAQEPAAYIHVPHHTVEGKVRPVVSFEKYQQDYSDGIYSTRIPLYTAPQPAPAPLSDDVVRDVAFEAVRKKLCALPRYSFVLDDDGLIRRVQDRVGNWIEFDEAHALFDPIAIDAALAAQGGRDAG